MKFLNPSPMEVCNSSFSFPTLSLTRLAKKTRLTLSISSSFPSFPPSNSPLLNPKNPPIISRFGGPTKRRNSLRKKLDDGSRVSPKNTKFNDPVLHFVDNQVSELNLDSFSDEIDGGSSKILGDSVLGNKLDGWVDLYKKDIEFWGIGFNPIFIVFQDSSNNCGVDKVIVDEFEILKRNGVDPSYFKKMGDLEEFNEVNSKIAHARFLAKEMESGKDVIPRNSSVAKFVVSGEGFGLVSRIRSFSVPKNVVVKVSRVGVAVFCGVLLVWVVKNLMGFGGEEKEKEMTSFEKEMLRRKLKARGEKEKTEKKEKIEKGSVEVVEEVSESIDVVIKRPQFDKEAVLDGIRKAKELNSDLSEGDVGGASTEMDFKIKKIQKMTKRAREIERRESSENETNDLDKEKLIKMEDKSPEVVNGNISENLAEDKAINGMSKAKFSEIPIGESSEGVEKVEFIKDSSVSNTTNMKSQRHDDIHNHDSSSTKMRPPMKRPARRMPKIICSVKEAREYLLMKNDKKDGLGDVSAIAAETNGGTVIQRLGEDTKGLESSDVDGISDPDTFVNVGEYETVEEMETDMNILNKKPQIETVPPSSNLEMDKDSSADFELSLGTAKDVDEMLKHSNLCEKSQIVFGETSAHDASPNVNDGLSSSDRSDKVADETFNHTDLGENSDLVPDKISSYNVVNEKIIVEMDGLHETPKPATSSEKLVSSGPEMNASIPTEMDNHGNFSKNYAESKPTSDDANLDSESSRGITEEGLFTSKESWLEKNFHEMDPIVNKIRSGFRDNFMVAREKVKEEVGTKMDFMDLASMNNGDELEWMKDEKLGEIVFKVRDNELAGRDPFHLIDVDEKAMFFKGLGIVVDKENQKLATLHQWLHSNIENLDYGADGISIYDPPEKVIPRWKGPPIDDIPDFLTNSGDQQREASSLQKVNQPTQRNITGTSQEASTTKPRSEKQVSKFSKTVIEGSDGSIKPGKKSGKEYWQHTKKWSLGFLECYNAESDPEVKATLKDVGKDLDRWITEKDIKEAADLMDKIPQRGKEFIEKKMNKIKREMELYGPQAVVSKYREYADEKEEDYLWWLDLPHVLCIELYIYEGEDQEVGFYTLEMAQDLELEPKPQHVIAFQDPTDCKNFCYIIQAHLEMLGKGNAFIIPQHPKDVFRQAKANGFGITVIRKGEVQLNIDQQLEEVEELISEIGTKMYHDQIMKDRSVDISTLMKGVLGVNKPIKRKRKMLAHKRPSKP